MYFTSDHHRFILAGRFEKRYNIALQSKTMYLFLGKLCCLTFVQKLSDIFNVSTDVLYQSVDVVRKLGGLLTMSTLYEYGDKQVVTYIQKNNLYLQIYVSIHREIMPPWEVP